MDSDKKITAKRDDGTNIELTVSEIFDLMKKKVEDGLKPKTTPFQSDLSDYDKFIAENPEYGGGF